MSLSSILITKLDNSQKRVKCRECKYYDRVFVPSYITNSDIVIVGEAPGRTESEKLLPFVGESGQLLRKLLREVGLNDGNISYFNVIKCHPENNETPTTKECLLCFKLFLQNELLDIQSKLIILAGSIALNAFFPGEKITEKKGNFLVKNNITFLPVLHPAYCLRNSTAVSILRKDLKKAEMFIRGNIYSEYDYKLIETEEELNIFYSKIIQLDIISVDIETNNTLDPLKEEALIYTISFGYGKKQSICIPLEHPENYNIKFKDACWSITKKILQSKVRKVFHYGIFDVKFLKKFGCIVNNYYADTLVMSFLLDENRNSNSLKVLASEYLDGCKFTYANTLKELALYNCEDTDNTLQLYFIFLTELEKYPKMLNLLLTILIPMCNVIIDMELEGTLIDVIYVKKLTIVLKSKVDAIEQLIEEKFPITKDVDLNSPKQLGELLFNTLRYESSKKTKTGRSSVDSEVLEQLERKGHELPKYILQLRKYEKLISTYVEKIPQIVHNDNRLRGSFNICGARTGRISSSEPNLQNIPRDKSIKKMFIAGKGNCLLDVDGSQMELRVGCSIANELVMIKAYQSDVDVHRLTASEIWGIFLKDVTKDQRQKAKSTNFGFLYGASPEGYQRLAENDYGLKVSLKECLKFREKFFNLYPGLLSWYDRTRENIRRFGYIEYPTGRLRRFPEAKGLKEIPNDIFRKGVNSPVQGSCLVGETKVDLLNGMQLTMKQLAEQYQDKTFWVYSITVDGKIVPGLARNPRKTGERLRTVRVFLDNNQYIDCTPNHRFMLRNGTYKEAQFLIAGESLMPLYKTVTTKKIWYSCGYEQIYHPGTDCWQLTHHMVRDYFDWPVGGEKSVCHHKNFNKLDNSSENLVMMSWSNHTTLHNLLNEKAKASRKKTMQSERYKKIHSELMKIAHKNGVFLSSQKKASDRWKNGKKLYSEEFIYQSNLHRRLSPEYKLFMKKVCSEKFAKRPELRVQSSEKFRKLNDKRRRFTAMEFTEYYTSISNAVRLKRPLAYINQLRVLGISVTKENYMKYKPRTIPTVSSIDKLFGSWEKFLVQESKGLGQWKSPNLNHKVVKVEDIGYSDVYDITVDKYNNFALSSGVFVHNSSDIILYTMVCLKKFITKLKIVGGIRITVHDSILVECKEDDKEMIMEEVRNIAQYSIPAEFTWLKVPMVFDFSVGYNWGEMEEVKKS